MILKASQRGGGLQLATHLLNAHDNERIDIADLRGAIAPDLHGAFTEWHACSKGTRCRKYLYSLSVNPDGNQNDLSREQYFDLIHRTEVKLGLQDQPRAVVFHSKHGREHCHVVWSRIDPDRMKAVQISNDWQKLQQIARDFARDHDLRLPEGMRKDPLQDKSAKPDRFENRKKREDLSEKQQQERSGESKEQRMALIAQAWQESHDGKTFVTHLEKDGYFLARGDKRAYVVVSLYGEVHSLSRQLVGVTAKALQERLASFPSELLPSVEQAQQRASAVLDRQRQLLRAPRPIKEPSPAQSWDRQAQERREALRLAQQRRRRVLDGKRLNMERRHAAERKALLNAPGTQSAAPRPRDAAPKRLLAFLRRITGLPPRIDNRHQPPDQRPADQYKRQLAALERRYHGEHRHLQRLYRSLASVERREIHSLKTALRREEMQRLVAHTTGDRTPAAQRATLDLQSPHPGPAVTDELRRAFNGAAIPDQPERVKTAFDKASSGGGGKDNQPDGIPDPAPLSAKEDFSQAAGTPLPPDLAAAFRDVAAPKQPQKERDRAGDR